MHLLYLKTYASLLHHFKVEEKFTMRPEISWNRAMDEVRIERLMSKHGMNTLVIIICVWPASENYEGKPELVASLEYLVCTMRCHYYCYDENIDCNFTLINLK